MSKMKQVYSSMIEATMNYITNNIDDDQIAKHLRDEFGSFFDNCFAEVIDQARVDLASFHRDMMYGAYSHEE